MKVFTIHIKEAVEEQPIQVLETILAQMNGIERALVDTDDGEVKIEYNEKQVLEEDIINLIQQHGLHVLKEKLN